MPVKRKHTAQLRHEVASTRRISVSAPGRQSVGESGFFSLRASITLLICTVAGCSMLAGALLPLFHPEKQMNVSHRTLTFAERVAYQQAIEEVYWRHRIWPKERPSAKLPLKAVMSRAELEKKVIDYLRKSQALEDYWQRPVTAGQLQAEIDRMASHTKQPDVLRELFAALGDDPFIVAECLARPVLAERLITELNNEDRVKLTKVAAIDSIAKAIQVNRPYHLPAISSPSAGCIDDTWTPTSTTNAGFGRYSFTAVW